MTTELRTEGWEQNRGAENKGIWPLEKPGALEGENFDIAGTLILTKGHLVQRQDAKEWAAGNPCVVLESGPTLSA